MDSIKYAPTTKDLKQEITLEDKDFMFYTLLTDILFELKRGNMKHG